MRFDKKRFLNNVFHLIRTSGNRKIGELEKECGVSAGYISRLANNEDGKPSIDFVANIAGAFGVSIDSILNEDFALLSKNLYVKEFIKKLIDDTINNAIEWEIKTNDTIEEYDERCLRAKITNDSYIQFLEDSEHGLRKDLYIITSKILPSGELEFIADNRFDPSAEIGNLVNDLYDCAFANADEIRLDYAVKSAIDEYIRD